MDLHFLVTLYTIPNEPFPRQLPNVQLDKVDLEEAEDGG